MLFCFSNSDTSLLYQFTLHIATQKTGRDFFPFFVIINYIAIILNISYNIFFKFVKSKPNFQLFFTNLTFINMH